MKYSLRLLLSLFIFKIVTSSVSFDVYAYLGQSLELRCLTNETSKFTRIQHILPNKTVETLLSNDYLNADFQRTEMHIFKFGHVYVLRIEPIRMHSAGLYSCEDDVSIHNKLNHLSFINVHVVRKCFFFVTKASRDI